MEQTRIIGGKKYIFAISKCKVCEKERFIRRSRIGKNTGLCRSCAWKKENMFWGFPKGEKHPDWKGGIKKAWGGYIMEKSENHPYADRGGYVRQHRLVMERKLGRHLLPYETVHHKNGIKTDNRPDNLELWIGNHGSGQRGCDLMRIVKSVEYGHCNAMA